MEKPKVKLFNKKIEEILKRSKANPIITTKDIPFACSFVFNCGAVKHNNKYYLLLRVQDLQMISHLVFAVSENGIDFKIMTDNILSPETEYESKGIEDPRITKINDKFYITYTAYSEKGIAVGLIETSDFKDFKRLGLILHPENKDVVLLPEKVNNKYLLYHRPSITKSIWVAYSPDLIHWGDHKEVQTPDSHSWDNEKIGAGAVPIKTEQGWLHIYHGVYGNNYRLGLALYDLADPSKLIRKSKNYILAPQEDYERIGGILNVVFTCGAILEDNKEVKIYYGAADTSICLATANIDELLEFVQNY